MKDLKKRIALSAWISVVVFALGTVGASAHNVTSTNVLDSASIAAGSPPRRVTLAGHYIPGTHDEGVGTCEISGRLVTGFARNTSTNVVTTLAPTTTTDGSGNYSLTSTTELANKATYAVYTIVQGFMAGGYQGTHGCDDATSNELSVSTI